MNLSIKSNISIFIGIPQLSRNDKYGKYLGHVLNSIKAQETDFKVHEPYITPPHSGGYALGEPSRLNAICDRMNDIVDKFLASDASHLMIVDGDVELPPHALDTLIRHNVDLASGVYPYHNFKECNAMIHGRMNPNNACGFHVPRDWEYMKGQVFGDEFKVSGGTGCIMIKRRVFKRYHPKIAPLRFSRENDCSLDTYFWKRCQDAGFTARLDCNVVCSHLPEYPLSKIDEWLT